MKKLLIVLLLFIITGHTYSQWVVKDPFNMDKDLNSLFFTNDKKGWIVGVEGTILHTDDGGKNWEQQISSTTNSLNTVFFVNDSVGWIVGGGQVFFTNNSGKNWVKKNSIHHINDVYFLNESDGWAAVKDTIFYTTNGGIDWNVQFVNPRPQYSQNFKDIQFVDDKNGWTHDVFLFNTKDGGQSWNMVYDGYISFTGFDFINDTVGWNAGHLPFTKYSHVYQTTDAGVTWRDQASFYNILLQAGHFVDENFGCVIGQEYHNSLIGFIFTTLDGGKTWKKKAELKKNWLNNVLFPDNNNGWIIGKSGVILNTTNGGNSWKNQNLNNYTFYDVHFYNSNLGWIAGGDPLGNSDIILKSDNGGDSWEIQSLNNYPTVRSLHFFDSSSGFAVGEHGTILNTETGGTEWSQKDSITNQNLNDIYFLNDSLGWIAGNQGTLFTTNNGGNSWVKLDSSISFDLRSVWFTDTLNGISATSGGIFKSTDSGKSWIRIIPGSIFDIDMFDVFFYNSNLGWISSIGSVYKTIDGGNNWVENDQLNLANYRSIYFISPDTGWVVGEDGNYIYQTIDGGENWKIQDHNTKGFYGLHFSNSKLGWAVGAFGRVLKTETGGMTFVEDKNGNIPVFNYQLFQNYPNPFNSITKINYFIPKFSHISITIFDLLGKQVKTIVNGYKSPGNYSVQFDANDLESGLYLYCLKTENFVQYKKILLVK